MEPNYLEFGGVRVGGDRGGENFFLSDRVLASPLAMPSAGFTFSSFPLEFPLAPLENPFAPLYQDGPYSPASSTHSANTNPPITHCDILSDNKPFCEPGQDLGAVDLEGLGLSFELPLLSALDSAFPVTTQVSEVIIEKVVSHCECIAPQPQPLHTSAAPTPAPSDSVISENDFSTISSPLDDLVASLADELKPEELPTHLLEMVRSLEELPPQDFAQDFVPIDTLAHLDARGNVSNALTTIETSAPIQLAPTQVVHPAGYGSVIVPNNLLAALPKSSSETNPTAIVLTQQQLKELNLPDDTLIVLKSDIGQLVFDLTPCDMAPEPQPLTQPQAIAIAPTTYDVVQSAGASRPKATPPPAHNLVTPIASSSLGSSSRYQQSGRMALKRVRARDLSESDKSEGSDPTWTPDEELDYASQRPKRMAVRRFPNLNLDDESDELAELNVSAPLTALHMRPLSPFKSPHKAGAKESENKETSSGRSGRKSQGVQQNRKERKRQQNREAAARYRQKKRTEHEDVEDSIDVVEERNKQLREQVERVRRECEAFKNAARLTFGPSLDRMLAEARAKASATARSSSHSLVHHAKF